MDDRRFRVRFPAGAGNFSQHRVENGSGAHPASYPMGTGGSLKRECQEAGEDCIMRSFVTCTLHET
jgi:hypothetical protein